MEENKKIKNIKLTLYITLILCLMVGVSYATYNLVLKGNKQHQVNIGSLTLTYEETNNINVTGDTLKTDEEGIASGNVFNFKVSVNNTTNKEINYIVYLTMDIEYLNNIDKGKVYLNNKTKNIVYGPSFITDLAKYKYENSYVLCTNTFTNATETHEYSLTSWISPKTNIFEAGGTHQTIIGGTVKFKVSVETVETTNLDTSGANTPILASNMIPVYYDETSDVWKKADKNNKATTVTYKLGDVNGDGNITADDLTEIARYLEGLSSNIKLKEKSADLDGDGKVTENDKNLLAKYVTKISSADFPAGAPLEEKTGTVINRWYSYESSGENKGMWANAVTVTSDKLETYKNAEIDTTISMDDITTMWVWIPRFNAVTPSNYNGGTADNPGTIDVTFVKQNETAIDAFTFGDKELSGFWYGKFETSHTTLASSTTKNNLGCTTETCSNANGIIIKPNVTILRYNNVSNFFYASRSMEQSSNSFGFVSSEVDTHMSKNNEWGAVAYLTQSIYGRCTSSTSCTEIGINNNSSFITGYGAPAGSDYTITNGAYNTDLGKDASTTGNIYGIYDMSGGTWEYVMGVYTDGTQNWSGNSSSSNSGFTGMLNDGTTYTGVAYPESKYYNSYTNTGTYDSPVTNYTNDMQHALIETKNWYSDGANFVISNRSWFIRGGNYNISSSAGVFYFSRSTGSAGSVSGVRLVITNE
ncbi:MAG: dockerin type I repeat-containing protein [Bacilli bacterium]|nr:dockerin type I repeat-containing protein [Bacilli bacterium]